MANINVDVLVQVKENATQQLQKVGDSFKSFGKDATSLGKELTTKLTLPIVALGAGMAKLAVDASKTEAVRTAFGEMTKGVVDSTDQFLASVKKATVGTLSNYEILTSANRALSLIGKDTFGNFQQDFTTMAEMVRKSSRATGYDINYLWDSLILGVGRGSKLILDNLGITTDITKAQAEYAKSLGKTAEELTATEQKTATLNHVMGLLHQKYDAVSINGVTAAEKMQELSATFRDLRDQVGVEVIPVLIELLNVLTPLLKEYVPILAEKIRDLITWFSNLDPVVQKIILVLAGLTTIIGPVITIIGILSSVIMAIGAPIAVAIAAILALGAVIIANWKTISEYVQRFISFKDTILSKARELRDWLSGNWLKWGIHFDMPDFGAIKDRLVKGWESIKNVIPHFQTGGMVGGSTTSAVPAVLHGGEKVIPSYLGGEMGRSGKTTGGSQLVINVSVGNYIGTQTELREFGRRIWEEIGNLARAQNKAPVELLNLNP